MRPLREEASDELERQASDLLAEASDRPGWTPEDKSSVWSGIVARASERERAFWPRLGFRLPIALAGSFALLAFALAHQRTRPGRPRSPAAAGARITATAPLVATENPWSNVDLGAVGTLRVERATVYRLPTAAARDYRIVLEGGTLCAEIAHRDAVTQGPLVIQTPHFEVVVVGTSFCVDVRGDISRVSVTQGRVQVQAPSGTAFVSAGETMASDDSRLRPAHPATPPARLLANSSPVRPSMPPPAAAQPALPPSSLAEQNALYSQGALARDRHDGPGALAAWTSFLHQFPQGVLAPEAAAGVLGELVEEGRNREALTAADDFLVRFPANGRAAEVAFMRGNLLREKLGRTADALAAYQQALGLASSPRLKDDALFAVGACQRMLGQTAAARETFKRYQTQFPSGVHTAELSRWLSENR